MCSGNSPPCTNIQSPILTIAKLLHDIFFAKVLPGLKALVRS